MAFHKATSWKERGLQLQAVKDKCNTLVQQLGLPDDDARAVALIQVRQFCNTLAAVPIKLQQNAEIGANAPVIMQILGVPNIKDLLSVLEDLNQNAKASFVTMVQFALENCVDRILHSLATGEKGGYFSANSKALIDLAGLSRPDQKHQLLLVPAWIRNSLHAGGIHRKSTRTIVVDGEEYRFEKGQRVECASWSHLFHVVGHALDVYGEILLSDSVAGLRRVDPE